MPTLEGIRLKVLKCSRIGFSKIRKKKLKSTNFTIISNNCWGGMIYESYNLPKQSPTIGLFFMPSDYIKFVSDLNGFLNGELSFISPEMSKWKDMPQLCEDKRYGSYPIGLLSNGKEKIEIFFLHYHSEDEAGEKWKRRCRRISWNKLIVKFNDQNGCTEKDVADFAALPYSHKIFFTCKYWSESANWKRTIDGYCHIRQHFGYDSIMTSYEPFGKNRYIDMTEFINAL